MPYDVAVPVQPPLIRSAIEPVQPGLAEFAINVRMPDGGWVTPPAVSGARLIDVLAAFGIPVRSAGDRLDGRGACRARIPAIWRNRLAPPSQAEAEMLATLENAGDSSRLLGHLVMAPELEGLEIELDWDALVPQTYWIAG